MAEIKACTGTLCNYVTVTTRRFRRLSQPAAGSGNQRRRGVRQADSRLDGAMDRTIVTGRTRCGASRLEWHREYWPDSDRLSYSRRVAGAHWPAEV
ncbi:hypothetical protein DSI35_06300 [Mycobacterium tuberculosis]|uniref:Uncharacterized protein n=4 Tax=Mycobacterium tuberculosis complex TaxID=77643 RepID=Q8VIQ7_MYCTO|nr:hypothetical protein MT4035.1 [Mycobacterium tuberculosis CDC1551]AKR03872.1 hypothetical protein Mb1595_p4349 [Mycobacterium tuberculosis variant bovis]APR59142.1 hypothetical protein BTU11_21500 [Mycobacterium tuberculosis]AYP10519.1 hypothetical protein EBQ37_00360 [Mycobacterium tuberculosis variant bovis BCG]EPZ62864.1 hypothetical protein TBKG_03863 [Mycobacterium tuberculosis '98-R604 INH-RIF-EM']KAK24821.1 hypothetical protein AZ55_23200 [Mycobacterium tuberculosis CWCFVRF MDRTB 670